MNRTLVVAAVLALSACGVSDPPFFEATSGAELTEARTSSPVDCVAMCEAAREQLIRDFSVLPSSIDCPRDFAGAITCAACVDRFATRFGVQPTRCP